MKKPFSRSISLFVLLYLLILFAERAQSVTRMLLSGVFVSDLFFFNIIALLSLLATVLMLCTCNRSFWRSLADPGAPFDPGRTALTCCALLVSGMMHTEYTIAAVQFVSYGALIVAMILATVNTARKCARKCRLWYSLVFVTVFSMAIPVCYKTAINAYAIFYFVEISTALLLIAFFAVMLKAVFSGKGEDLLLPAPVLFMTVCDAAVILMRLAEEINWFVLIFASLALVMFVVGKIAYRK